ncbi:WD repeat and SOCS box-containing protein 1 isoform X2 [Esox lucius]|uniref:WD repeat and SOCS box-containing protein 1 isoform X2 n=1 Tax=Esox lucius TaxID=8010 RepID=UPI00097337BC|nr:WD repeat and SOCS box-containing protein 1 isoform X2 [Esox lucius]
MNRFCNNVINMVVVSHCIQPRSCRVQLGCQVVCVHKCLAFPVTGGRCLNGFEGRERRADIEQPVQNAGWGHQCHRCCHTAGQPGACLTARSPVFLWDMDKYSLIRKLEGHHNDVVSCEFSPDGALLATASYDTRVIVWDPYMGTMLLELAHLFPPPSPIFAGGANDRWVRSVAFCHDGRHIASITDDRMVRFWSIEEKSPQAIAPITNGLCCAFSTDGSVLAAGSRDGSVHFWASPNSIASLQHLCRMALRRVMPTQQVQALPIPSLIRSYLSYQIL